VSAYDAVLFDNDGVLVAPPAQETQAAAIRDAFAEVGVGRAKDEHVSALRHGVTVDLLEDIAGAYDLDPAALWAARERHDERSQFDAFRAGERSLYDDVSALDDVVDPQGVVSNNHHTTVEFVLEFFGLGETFDTFYGREKTVESLRLKKPNTHYLDLALADLDGDSALYVGDSTSDVVAAHRAGMDSVFVRREHNRDTDHETPPTFEVTSLHEVVDIAAGEEPR
jgi:phosphoglycolate phosphatase